MGGVGIYIYTQGKVLPLKKTDKRVESWGERATTLPTTTLEQLMAHTATHPLPCCGRCNGIHLLQRPCEEVAVAPRREPVVRASRPTRHQQRRAVHLHSPYAAAPTPHPSSGRSVQPSSCPATSVVPLIPETLSARLWKPATESPLK